MALKKGDKVSFEVAGHATTGTVDSVDEQAGKATVLSTKSGKPITRKIDAFTKA